MGQQQEHAQTQPAPQRVNGGVIVEVVMEYVGDTVGRTNGKPDPSKPGRFAVYRHRRTDADMESSNLTTLSDEYLPKPLIAAIAGKGQRLAEITIKVTRRDGVAIVPARPKQSGNGEAREA